MGAKSLREVGKRGWEMGSPTMADTKRNKENIFKHCIMFSMQKTLRDLRDGIHQERGCKQKQNFVM